MNEYLFPVIADFGLSKDSDNLIESKFIGTLLYAAPEVHGELKYSTKSDVFAYSFILYEILTFEKPFKNIKNSFTLTKTIIEGHRPDISRIPEPYRGLIEICWQQNPDERPSFDEIVDEIESKKDFLKYQVEEDDFLSYVDYIKECHKSFDKSAKPFAFKFENAKVIKKVHLKKSPENSEEPTKYPQKSTQKISRPNLKAKYDSEIDIVFLIDGTKTNKFFYDALKNSIESVLKKWISSYTNVHFRFGAVIYRNLAVSQETVDCEAKPPFVVNLTEEIDQIQSFFNDQKTSGGGSKYANDWSSGYQAILDQINWNEKAEKVVIHICDSPSLGKDFTMKFEWFQEYVKTPKFEKNKSFKQNLRIYKKIQEKQKTSLCLNIQKLAEKKIMFFCLNGNENALFCFNKVSSFYFKNGGKKFVIKDLFGYSAEKDSAVNSDQLKKDIVDFFDNVVENCIQNKTPNQFENKCKQDFVNDLNDFYENNDSEYNSAEDEIEDIPFDISHFVSDDDSDTENDDE